MGGVLLVVRADELEQVSVRCQLTSALPDGARDQQDGDDGAHGLPPELGTLLQYEGAEAKDHAGEKEKLPVELLAAFFGLGLHVYDGAPANALDDAERDVAVGLAAHLEVLAAACRRNLTQAVAVENGVH